MGIGWVGSRWRLRKRFVAPSGQMHRVFFVLKEVLTGFVVELVTGYEGSFGGRRCGVSMASIPCPLARGLPPQFGMVRRRITMNIELGPEEARRFLGLPDVAPTQEELLQEYRDCMRLGMGKLATGVLMNCWIAVTGVSCAEIQKTFWSRFAGTLSKE